MFLFSTSRKQIMSATFSIIMGENCWLHLLRRSATARNEREWLILEIISYSRKLYEALIDGRSSHAVRAFAILNAAFSHQSLQ